MTRRLITLVFASLAAAAPAARAQPRPLVLLVHGRGQATRDSAALRRDALEALRESARAAAVDHADEADRTLRDDDVRVVWYADLLDPRRTVAPCTLGAAVASSASVSPLGTIAMIAGALLGAAADGAQASRDSAGAGSLRALVGDLRFLGDGDTRCAAERRVGDALAAAHREGRPVVLVAHSLGALVAWDYLARRAAPERADVERLVTLGSPVGSADVRRLVFGDDGPGLGLPRAVRSWVNVVHAGDPFATRLRADSTAVADTALSDVAAESARGDPHDLLGYLADPATARAVLGAWCAAARDTRGVCRELAPPPRVSKEPN
jgi:pimeloyl-ACP methyl ester carboxylesterase